MTQETNPPTLTDENNFPTVKQGSQALTLMALAIVFKGLISTFTTEANAALASILAALAGTHAALIVGKGFIKSQWATPTPNMVTEETKKTTITSKDAADVPPVS